jgi:hypothetical protein
MHIRLTRTIQRNLLMVESAQAALSDKNEVSHAIECVVQDETSIGSMKFIVFWDIAPCSHIEVDRHFRGAYCLHHQGNHDDGGSMHL